MALVREGGYTGPLISTTPTPRVSTPAPYGVPQWGSEGIDTAALDDAYSSYYRLSSMPRLADQFQTPQVTNGLHLKSLKTWAQEGEVERLRKEAERTDALNAQAAQYAGGRLQNILGGTARAGGQGYGSTAQSMIPSGRAGLSAYGVSKSGLSNQKGKGVKGLQADYSTALLKMFADMRKQGLGTPGITDGWRSYESQVAVKRSKGDLAATPGKSVHGIGYAADLALNSKQQKWMEQNAWRYGIYRLQSEPWHWQYWPAKKRG